MRKEVYLSFMLFCLFSAYGLAQCQISSLTTTDALCFGNNDGTVSVEIANATLPLTYTLFSAQGVIDSVFGQGSSFSQALPEGTYTITAIDANNCSVSNSFTINSPNELVITSVNVTDVDCFGGSSGSIEVVVVGGTAPYLYSLDGAQNTTNPVFAGVDAGIYQVTVIDNNGCETIETIVVNEPSSISVIVIPSNALCSGDISGWLDAIVSGGTANYFYLWSNGQVGPSINNLSAGTYTVTVTDDNGCTAEATGFVSEPAPIALNASSTDALCGSCNGGIDLTVTGGTPPYLYEWNDPAFSGVEDLSGLCAGVYVATVIDVNGCAATLEIEVVGTVSNDVTLIASVTGASCNDCDGGIDIIIQCGIPGYTIEWSDPSFNGQTNLTNLCTGTYSVTVTDTEGNLATGIYDITVPPPLEVSIITTTTICNGECSGSFESSVTGGTPPYTYFWAGGPEPVGADLCSGPYDFLVTDADGCTVSTVFDILEPAPIELTINSIDVSCIGNGEAWVEVNGGIAPYNYDWSNGVNGDRITDLSSGNYWLTVTDAEGCTASDSVFIDTPIAFDLSSTPADCDSMGGTATVELISMITNPTFAWSNSGTGAVQNNLAPGGYSVTVTDQDNGCSVHRNVQVPLDTACFVRISGFVYNDELNPDCVFDSTTNRLQNIMVRLNNGSIAFTDAQGFYEFTEEPGTYTIEVVLNTSQYEDLCNQPISVVATTTGGNYPFNNFWLKTSGERDLVIKVNKRNARPGFQQWVRICVMNYGSVPMDGTLTFVHDAIQEYDRTTIPFTNYDLSTQTMTWDFTDHPVGQTIVYTVYFNIPVNTPLGTPLTMDFRVDPIVGDINPDDNELKCEMLVTGSYDPNDKQVTPSGEGEEGGISRMDTLLSYQIRFQNTGTDTAFTVVLRDTLDDNLDISTLVPGPASHPYTLNVEKGNILEFTFNNIMLPDSFVNEPASNGFVFFDIQLKRGLEYGTMVNNTAAIYFDFNAPIITNTVTNTLRRPVGLRNLDPLDIGISVSPNPTFGIARVSYELEAPRVLSMQLYDHQGRHVRELEAAGRRAGGWQEVSVHAQNLSPGLYFITLEGEDGVLGRSRLVVGKQ